MEDQEPEMYECPGCKYKMSAEDREHATFDWHCPRCIQHTLREFTPVKRVNGTKPGK